jgi:hypothetical protein
MNDDWGNQDITEEIHEWSVSSMEEKPSQVIHIVGAPSSGKTHLELFLSYALKHIYPVAQVVCGTEDTQNAFTPVFGGAFVNSSYDENIHKRLFQRQMLCKKEKCEYNHLISIIDDTATDKEAMKASRKAGAIVKAHKMGSQWFDELLIMGYQSINDISEDIYNVPSKVFIFFEKETSNRQKIHRHYFKTILPKFEDFTHLMNTICEKNVALVVDLKKNSANLQECVYYFKAPAWKHKDGELYPYPEGWRFGCKQFREWSDTRWDPNIIPDFIQDLQAF